MATKIEPIRIVALVAVFLAGILCGLLGAYLATPDKTTPADHYFLDLDHDGVVDVRIMPIDSNGRLRGEIPFEQGWIEVHVMKCWFQCHEATGLSDATGVSDGSKYFFANGKWWKEPVSEKAQQAGS